MKDELDFEKELKKRNLGFSVYANLEDRDFADEKGYDRYNDDVEVTKHQMKECFFNSFKLLFRIQSCVQILWVINIMDIVLQLRQ